MHLPPQAYTKETLVQAYNWLRSQPPHVQELAKTPDALVALYTKAQMHGENYFSRANLQGFKSELKSLANMMGELDDSSASIGSQSSPSPPLSANKAGLNTTMAPSISTSPNVPMAQPAVSPQPIAPAGTHVGMALGENFSGTVSDPSYALFNGMNASNNRGVGRELRNVLDARSWTMIQEVKNHFNLSSEAEAVRLLIAMGYQKMRSQF